jgi:hypothetical protein
MSAAVRRLPVASKSRVANELQQLAHLAQPGAAVSALSLAEEMCSLESTVWAMHEQADALISAVLRLLPDPANGHPARRLDAASRHAGGADPEQDIKHARLLLDRTLRAQILQLAEEATKARADCGLRPAPGVGDA